MASCATQHTAAAVTAHVGKDERVQTIVMQIKERAKISKGMHADEHDAIPASTQGVKAKPIHG
jgi:hypothetical protein